MKRDLILVIDMQNVYANGGVWYCPKVQAAAENIKHLLKRKQGESDVIFTQFLAEKKAQGTWEEYNRVNASVNEDAYANEMMEIFSEDIKKFPVYVKSSYSSFTIPEIKKATCHADRVVLTGVVAECCVLSTAFALIDEGVKVLYLTDAVAGIDDETEMAAVKVLEGLCPTQVQLMTTKEYLETMGKDEN